MHGAATTSSHAFATGFLTLVALFSGCVDTSAPKAGGVGPESSPELVWTEVVADPEGDAVEGGTRALRSEANYRTGSMARAVLAAIPDVATRPADPTLDVRWARFGENSTTLVVELGLSSVDPQFLHAASTRDQRFTTFGVCWYPEAGARQDAFHCATLRAFRVSGVLNLIGSYIERGNPDCELSFQDCWVRVPTDIDAGTPGTLRWHIPREIVTGSGQGQRLIAICAAASSPNSGGSNPHVEGAARLEGDGCGNAVTKDFTFTTPRSPSPRPEALWVEDVAGDITQRAGGNPEVDLLGFEIVETSERISFIAKVARLNLQPTIGHIFEIDFATPNIEMDLGFAVVPSGEREIWVSWDDGKNPERDVPMTAQFKPGSPGWINLSFARDSVEGLNAGDRIVYGDAYFWPYEKGTAGAPVEAIHLQSLAMYMVGVHLKDGWMGGYDAHWAWPSYWLQYNTTAAQYVTSGNRLEVIDATGDTSMPRTALLASGSHYDIHALRGRPLAPDRLEMTLQLANFTRQEPPPGYSAALYAVGLRVDDRTIMVLYEQRKGGASSYCGPDTLVFESSPKSPGRTDGHRVASWPGRASVIFDVPYACFGEAFPPGPLFAEQVSAATFLVPEAAGSDGAPVRVDGLNPVDGVALGAAAPNSSHAPEPASWLAAPFGLPNFWDILGIAMAVGLSTAGAITLQRKRRLLHGYMTSIEAAKREQDPRVRQRDLLEIRGRLKEDLLRGRLSDGHYVTIERALDSNLGNARILALGQEFGDLPHKILVRLEELLADGMLSPEDFRSLVGQLETTGLKRDAKDRIRRQLLHWLKEDGASTPLLSA